MNRFKAVFLFRNHERRDVNVSLKDQKFGIEIELTGLTREKAANVIAAHFGTQATYFGGGYYEYHVMDNENRKWKLVYDSSITGQTRSGEIHDSNYKVELVSPICKYEDIETIQEIVRKLRAEGAMTNNSCGIHIHINGAPYTAQTLRNLTNIMASKEDMIYKTMQVHVDRERHYCEKVDRSFLEELHRKKPKDLSEIQKIWYNGHDGSGMHYHESRYHCLNLHSLFSKGTVEFRLFNSTTHAGKIKSYIQFCLAVSNQALTQKCASRIRTTSTNEKYTFRCWLLRLGLIGEEFKTARTHLLKNLDGCIAWKNPEDAIRQREEIKARRALERQQTEQEKAPANEVEVNMDEQIRQILNGNEPEESVLEQEHQEAPEPVMSM